MFCCFPGSKRRSFVTGSYVYNAGLPSLGLPTQVSSSKPAGRGQCWRLDALTLRYGPRNHTGHTAFSPAQPLLPGWQLKLRGAVTGPRSHSHLWRIPSSCRMGNNWMPGFLVVAQRSHCERRLGRGMSPFIHATCFAEHLLGASHPSRQKSLPL